MPRPAFPLHGLAGLLLLECLGTSLTVGAAPKESPCAQDYADIINSNARIPAHEYRRTDARNLLTYRKFLGADFTRRSLELGPGKVWIDSAGGFGIAAWEVAARQKATVHVVNAQDFWGAFKDGFDPSVVTRFGEEFEVSGKGLPKKHKLDRSNERYWDSTDFKASELKLLRKRVLEKVDKEKKAGTYTYHVGFSEVKIPEIPDQADLLTDLYGAFFYSADRMKILDLYYSKLKEGGTAFIRLKSDGGLGVSDSILPPRKGQPHLDLIAHLMEKFPDVFTLAPDNSGVLIMRKSKKTAELGLEKHLVPEEIRESHFDDTGFPSVVWKFKR